MKQYISIILTICLILSVPSFVRATEANSEPSLVFNNGISSDAVEELLERMEKAGYLESFDGASSNERIAYPVVEREILEVPLCKQSERYYCGPASGKMVIDYLNGDSILQDTVASAMETNADNGTGVYACASGLNSFLLDSPYTIVSTSQASFFGSLKYSIDQDYPVVCNVLTGALPNYASHQNFGHYVVATGYYHVRNSANGSDDVREVYYNDPHYNDAHYGSHICQDYEMTYAINNNHGLFIMGGEP